MSIECTAWRQIERNTLRGFATLVITRMGLEIADCAVHESHGRRWVSLPAKPMIDGQGQVMRDDRGKVRYSLIMKWTSREVSDRFQAAALEAIDRHLGNQRQPDPHETAIEAQKPHGWSS